MKKLKSSKINQKNVSYILFSFTFLCFGSCISQNLSYNLTHELKEISGIECLNDSIFIALNDGGNGDYVYMLNENFEVLKKITVDNFKNHDWEDTAIDEEYIYIADIGNNNNRRKNLKIGRIKIRDIYNKSVVKAEIMTVRYESQVEYPPSNKNLNYDAETLISDGEFLYIFSKNRTVPFDGISFIYKFKFSPNSLLKLTADFEFTPGQSKWIFDSFTGGSYHNGFFYLITYNKLFKLKLNENGFTLVGSKQFNGLKQREAICLNSHGKIFIANEFHKWLGNQKVRLMSWKTN